jgi:antitoxin VapB
LVEPRPSVPGSRRCPNFIATHKNSAREVDPPTLTEAIRTSLHERLRRERLKRGRLADLADALEAIARRGDALPILDRRAAEEILGYDANGLPS